MNARFLAAAAFALALLPAAANAQRERHVGGDAVIGTHEAVPRPAGEYRTNAGDHVVTFLTRVIVPDFNDRQRPIPYADNPDLIGNRYGASDPAWRK